MINVPVEAERNIKSVVRLKPQGERLNLYNRYKVNPERSVKEEFCFESRNLQPGCMQPEMRDKFIFSQQRAANRPPFAVSVP